MPYRRSSICRIAELRSAELPLVLIAFANSQHRGLEIRDTAECNSALPLARDAGLGLF
jgi:hypothetical protein